MAARPGSWPAVPAEEIISGEETASSYPSEATLSLADLGKADWLGAEQRRRGGAGQTLDLSATYPGSDASAPVLVPPEARSGPTAQPAPAASPAAAPRRRRGWVTMTRLWAVLKVASMAYTTWWAMGYVHAGIGTTVSAYGAVCLFAGFGARWRKRFFGPGQLIEPEIYEEIGRWLYRLGVVLVLVGGAAVTAQYLSR